MFQRKAGTIKTTVPAYTHYTPMSHCEILVWIILRIHVIPTSANSLSFEQMYVAVTVREEESHTASRAL